MLRFIPTGVGKVLEFGCGEGNFSALLKDRFSAETWAVEINDRCAQIAAAKLHRVINNDANRCLKDLPNRYFDCIICFDFLEHLADPYTFLTNLKSKLTQDGVIISSIPNIRYFTVFRDFVLHGNWDYKDQGVMDRTHLRFFTYKSIVKMFQMLGFELVRIEGAHPTSSRSCRILQWLTFNALSDIRYKHFITVAKIGSHNLA